jgi:hypothetical protein
MPSNSDPFLTVVLNLSKYHREHEKFYAESPLHEAIALSRSSSALKALAERWSTVQRDEAPLPSPFAGAVDLNDERAIDLLGVLFMEGAGEPAEITRMKTDLGALAEASRSTGAWLATAMEASWGVIEHLVAYRGRRSCSAIAIASSATTGSARRSRRLRAGVSTEP